MPSSASVFSEQSTGRASNCRCPLRFNRISEREFQPELNDSGISGPGPASLCTGGNARHQKGELGKVPAIERQRQNLLRVQYGAQRGGLALNQRSLARDRDAVGHLPETSIFTSIRTF